IGKGLAGSDKAAGQAKRVFLVHNGSAESPINENIIDTSTALTIGVAGTGLTGFSRPISLTTGGSVKNWVSEINDQQKVKDFFKTNDVTIDAIVGGHPTGLIRFKNIADSDVLPNTSNGTIKLTIGDYSNTVTLFDVDADTSTETTDDDQLPDDVPFSAKIKKAITHVDSNADPLLTAIADALIGAFPPFPQYDGTTAEVGSAEGERPDVAGHVPYGITARHTLNGVSETAIIGVLDAQSIAANIDVQIDNKIKETTSGSVSNKLKVSGGTSAKIRKVNIKNDPNTIQITLTSDDPGGEDSTIGQPSADTQTSATDFLLPVPPTDLNNSTGGATVFGV
ncbi:MAG: hypothetical protein OXC92_02385, partial [Flavobacteriaceae bacterium]|nr:hypothetical protein [Flavobacteriaceae bacterium]